MHNNFDLDTIVVPAHPRGFNDVFVDQLRWPNVKIDSRRRGQVKYIAVYQTSPVSAITHYAEISAYETTERSGRYDIILRGRPVEIKPIPYTASDVCAPQGPRYTALETIMSARGLTDAFPS